MAESSVRIVVYGHVQGVFFRAFAAAHSRELGLTGYVRNLPSGDAVEVEAEGERSKLEQLISYLKVGPPGARVRKVETVWSAYTGSYSDFTVRH